jgi:hypothetical protein
LPVDIAKGSSDTTEVAMAMTRAFSYASTAIPNIDGSVADITPATVMAAQQNARHLLNLFFLGPVRQINTSAGP